MSIAGPAPDPQTVTKADPSPLDATAILTEGLEAMLDKADIAKYFVFEDAPFFSQRENQLVQAYMQQYGGMPPGVGADEMDDLF